MSKEEVWRSLWGEKLDELGKEEIAGEWVNGLFFCFRISRQGRRSGKDRKRKWGEDTEIGRGGRKRDGERGKSIAGMRAGVSKGDRNLWGKGAGRKKGPGKSQGVRRKWNGKREKLI